MNSVRTIALTPYYDHATEQNINFLLPTTVLHLMLLTIINLLLRLYYTVFLTERGHLGYPTPKLKFPPPLTLLASAIYLYYFPTLRASCPLHTEDGTGTWDIPPLSSNFPLKLCRLLPCTCITFPPHEHLGPYLAVSKIMILYETLLYL